MSNVSNSTLVNRFYDVTAKYAFYSSVVIMTAGLISNVLIILILSHLRIFRGNQCAFYLVVESFANIGLLSLILSSRILSQIFHIDPVHLSVVWCRIRSWSASVFALISLMTICFATFDQYLSTNYRYSFRQFSTLKLARYLTIFNINFSVLHNLPLLILSEIRSSGGCSTYNPILVKYFSYFYYPVLTSSLPVIITSSFSLLAYHNVRHLIRRQVPVVRRRLDRQLTAMVLARVVCLVAFGLPYIIYSLCALNIRVRENDLTSSAILRLVEAIMLSLLYTNYSINFFVFLFISSRFRNQVKHFLTKKCCRHVRSHQVAPNYDHHAISVIDID